MRVIVNENFKMFHGHQPIALEHGQIVTGSLAELLARSARKRVTVLEDNQSDANTGQKQQDPPPPPDDVLDIDASVADVLAWAGEHPERASEALRQEQAKDSPRSTLVKQLTKIAE